MDIQNLGIGSPFYVLRKGEKPVLETGVVKTKSQPRAKFPTQTPNIMQGMQMQQVIDVTVTINGKDEVFSEIPINDRGLDEIIALSHVTKLSKYSSNIHADHRG